MSKMLGRLAVNSPGLYQNGLRGLKTSSRKHNYYFVLPEIPSDTVETNAIMRLNDNIPALNELTPEKVQNGVQKLVVNYDSSLNGLYQKFESEDKKVYDKTFDSLFKPIEEVLAPLDYAYKTARHLSFIYPFSKYHLGFMQIDKKVNLAKNERWTNRTLFKALKEISSNRHLLSDSQARLLDRSIRNCVLNGLNFNEAEYNVCIELNNKIQEKQTVFKQRLDFANKKFGLRITDPIIVENIPHRIKAMISNDRTNPEKGPWTIVPNHEIFQSFMKNCSNRILRQSFYEAYYSRASYVNEQFESNNSEVIRDILKYRKKQAVLYGYNNFAELVVENKAAVKIENITDLFEKIKTNLKPVADEEYLQLQKFAAKHGNVSAIENYDLEFWKTKHTNLTYGVDQEKIREYFPFRKVLNGLFDLTKSLFNVEFKLDTSQNDRLWNKSVEVYNLINENGEHLSTLVIDPFIRENKIDNIWGYSGREASASTNTKPLAYLMMNVRDYGQKSSLTFDQVKQLFSEFGGLIQTLMTKTDYIELSDRHMIETDAVNLTNKLFERLLYVPQVMNSISAHLNTGEPVTGDLLKRLKNGDSNLQLFNLMKQTLLSAFDIECHISEKFWYEIMEEMWPKFMQTKLLKSDYRPCQFTSIFGENFGCNYYSLIWSEMLANDLLEAFNEVGFENRTKLAEVGSRYRNTFLLHGSSLASNELFRQFRGRNPSMDPFIKSYSKN